MSYHFLLDHCTKNEEEPNNSASNTKCEPSKKAHGTFSNDGVKIIMTTTVDDIGEVIRCFQELCDAYLMKPIDLGQLLSQMKSYRMVQ